MEDPSSDADDQAPGSEENQCFYHLCRKETETYRCKYCNNYFCEKHLKAKPPYSPSFNSNSARDRALRAEWSDHEGHPCPPFVERWEAEQRERKGIIIRYNHPEVRFRDRRRIQKKENLPVRVTVIIGALMLVILFLLTNGFTPKLWVDTNNYYTDSSNAIFSEQVWINENTYLAYPNGSSVYVRIYRNATDPTYDQLIDFLKKDNTAYATYVPGSYVCANFAVHLFNNAEKNGIKAHIVTVNFVDNKDGHAINSFSTTDLGMIFVDATGNTAEQNALGAPPYLGIVDLKTGSPYIRNPIIPLSGGWTVSSMGIVQNYQILN